MRYRYILRLAVLNSYLCPLNGISDIFFFNNLKCSYIDQIWAIIYQINNFYIHWSSKNGTMTPKIDIMAFYNFKWFRNSLIAWKSSIHPYKKFLISFPSTLPFLRFSYAVASELIAGKRVGVHAIKAKPHHPRHPIH